MNPDDGAPKDGPPAKSFRLWHVQGSGEFVAFVAEADSFEEIKRVRRRDDWRYRITRDGAPRRFQRLSASQTARGRCFRARVKWSRLERLAARFVCQSG
jgi:hypothetical protein